MVDLSPARIAAIASDEELFKLLGDELARRLPRGRRADDEFVAELRALPVGLRSMAATFELSVSLCLDDLGWHFGNWHHQGLAAETSRGLRELGAGPLAEVFDEALRIAVRFWDELGRDDWAETYHGSELERLVTPLNDRACALNDEKDVLDYWVPYARRFPERVT